ncbi:hypothetical protein SRHO_G00260800 [Serrasalmus rhombeus]
MLLPSQRRALKWRSRRLCCGQLSTPLHSYSVAGETVRRAELLKIQRLRFQIQELIFSRDVHEALLMEMTGILFQVLLLRSNF